jgi:hypothetical protein
MSKIGYYILGAVTAGVIGLSLGSVFSKEVNDTALTCDYYVLKADQECTQYMPGFLKSFADWINEFHTDKTPEEIEALRAEHLSRLERELGRQ